MPKVMVFTEGYVTNHAQTGCETFEKHPLSKSALICPISALRSNFNPRNNQYIPMVKILTRLDLDQNWAFFKGLDVIPINMH